MDPLYAKFFQYLEDIGEQKFPLKIKFLNPDQFTITPEDLDVKGSLDLSKSKITSLPDNLKVEGYLDLYGTSTITSLPDNLQVGNNLYLTGTKITSLPKDLQVKGSIFLFNTPLFFKTEAEIRQMAPGIKGEIFGLKN